MNILKKLLILSLVLLSTPVFSMDPPAVVAVEQPVEQLVEGMNDPSIQDPNVNWADLPDEMSVMLAEKLPVHEVFKRLEQVVAQKVEPVLFDCGNFNTIFSGAVSADGHRVIMGSRGAAHVYVYEGGGWRREEVLKVDDESSAVNCVAFSNDDGCRAIVSSDGDIFIWSYNNAGWGEKEVLASPRDDIRITSVLVSSCGQKLVAGCYGSSFVWVKEEGGWRGDGELVHNDNHRRSVQSLAFAEDGGVLTGDSNGGVQHWLKEGEGWRCQDVLERNDGEIRVAFSANGQKIVTASHIGKIQIWVKEDEGWRCEYEEQLPNDLMRNASIGSVAFSGCDQRVAVGVNGYVYGRVITLTHEREGWHREATLQRAPIQIKSATFSSCGGFLVMVPDRNNTGSLQIIVRFFDIRPLKKLSEAKKYLLLPQALVLACNEGMLQEGKKLNFADPKWAELEQYYEELPDVVRGSFNDTVRVRSDCKEKVIGVGIIAFSVCFFMGLVIIGPPTPEDYIKAIDTLAGWFG